MVKKKESAIWWLTKNSFKGGFWIVKNSFKGIFWVAGRGVKFAGRKIKESKERTKIESSPAYKIPAKFSEFRVHKKILGDFDYFHNRLMKESLIALIFGKRGSGKSAFGFRVVENIHNKTGRKGFALGVKSEVLPSWIKSIGKIEEAADGGIVLIDEGAIEFGSRNSMSEANKNLAGLMAIARHKDLTLLFITQNTGMLDKNVLKLADTLVIKEGSLLQLEMERNEMKRFYARAKGEFDKISGERRNYSYFIDSDFEGFVQHELPSFWSDGVSKNKG